MENRSWFVHLEFVVILVTIIGGFVMLESKLDRQSERTDTLYVMFIDLIKSQKE